MERLGRLLRHRPDGRVDQDHRRPQAIAGRLPRRGFGDDSTRINVEQIFKLLSPGTEVKSL